MTDSKHSFWSAPTLLFAALMVTVSTGTPILAHAAVKSKAIDQQQINVRNKEEKRLKMHDKSNAKHAIVLAKQYEEAAKLVASQGGDSKPLLDAAAYFASQSK